MKNIIITGGSGFIGTNLILFLLKKRYKILNLDKLSNSSNTFLINKKIKNYSFIKFDLSKIKLSNLNIILKNFKPDYIINLASETHVDISIEKPKLFMESNISSTLNLLIACTKYDYKKNFKFIHIGTDEVYGHLKLNDKKKFNEKHPMNPRNPYSASKTGAINFVNSFFNTYNLPSIIINPSNNFGNFQYPEKFIPKTILSILSNKKVQVYGNGKNIRDWIHVGDTVKGIYNVMLQGKSGETYNVSANNSISNLELVKKIFKILKKDLDIIFVQDRPGHDEKYLSSNKKLLKLGWKPKIKFNKSIEETIKWYTNKDNLKSFKQLNKTYQRLGKKIK